MAVPQVRLTSEFCNSPFGAQTYKQTKRKASRHVKSGRHKVRTPYLEAGERLYGLAINHLIAKCRVAGIRFEMDVPKMVMRLEQRPMWPSLAWDWLINDLLRERMEDIRADGALETAIAFARGKVAAMYEYESNMFSTKVQAKARTAELKRKFEAERSENGGDAEFFNSNSWQRLRFEVLRDSDGCCQLCGRNYRDHGVALEVDHIKPRSRFPNLSLDRTNLQVLCFDCNRGKGNRCTIDWSEGGEGAQTD